MAKEKKGKKEKKAKKVYTKEQKLVRKRKRLIIATSIFSVLFLFFGITGIVTVVGSNSLLASLKYVQKVNYQDADYVAKYTKPIVPVEFNKNGFTTEFDANGRVMFDKDNDCFNIYDKEGILDSRNFKILQLTDVHLGAGAFSMRTDQWTRETVVDLVTREKPDLVVVTGDIAYPIPFQSATLDNEKEAEIFATMMENLGVYWTLAFGNHDTESFSQFNREEIGHFYATDPRWKHCIFTDRKAQLDGKDVFGVGNFPINIINKDGEIIHTIFMIDSNAYEGDSIIDSIAWSYDNIHDDQIAWYKKTATNLGLVTNNGGKIEVNTPSTMYFHIPPVEYRTVYNDYQKYSDPNVNDGATDKIRHCDGFIGEHTTGALGTYKENDLIAAVIEYGTRGIFTGHDHLNNASYLYNPNGIKDEEPGVKLTYGMSIDYLAYIGIYKETAQRGARVIEINELGTERLATETVRPMIKPKNSGKAVPMSETTYNKIKAENRDYFGWNTRLVPYWKDLNKGINFEEQ